MKDEKLKLIEIYSLFSDVNDVDLFAGALAETPLKGAVVGPTIGCILAHQFSSLRKSDRFWYENDVPPSSFTKGIRSASNIVQ